MGNDLPARWQEQTLEHCTSAIIDYRGKTPTKVSSGIPLVTAKIIKNGRIETPDEFIAPEDYDVWMRRGLPMAGDVVMTTEAPLGEVGQLDGSKVALAQRVITLRGKPGILDNGYLKYMMQSSYVQEQLRARASGTTVLGIKQSELRRVILRLPPLEQQKAIAHILGTLDDKIELNRRMNKTLEAMARALFKSWFVDFDPVYAKAEGRQLPDMDPATAALFPGAFQDSHLGSIPKGWDITALSKLCSYFGRGISPKYVDQGGVLVLNQKCVRGGAINSALGRRHDAGKKEIDGRELQLWDVLINSTGVGTLGRVGQIRELSEVTIVDSHVTVVRAGLGVATPQFLGTYLLRAEPEIEALGEGSTGQTELSRSRLGAVSLVVPPLCVQEAFDGLVLPLRLRQAANQREARALAMLRDALLPRLLSGELSVGKAMKALEARA